MAISHVQPLFLLLVSLFFLPALGVTKFRNCHSHEYPVDVNTVEISPDPVKRSGNANITITANTSKDIPDGVTVNLGLSAAMLPVSLKTYSLCDVTACPVAPGPFVLTFSNIFTKTELKGLKYQVSVSISENEKRLGDQMMCVMFTCSITRGFASLLSQVTG